MKGISKLHFLHQLASVEVKKNDECILHFNDRPELFVFQRQALTAPSVIEFYVWFAGFIAGKNIWPSLFDDYDKSLKEKTKSKMIYSTYHEIQLYTLSASHPKSVRCSIKPLTNDSEHFKAGKDMLICTFEFYSTEGVLLFKTTNIVALLSKKRTASLNIIREKVRKNIVANADSTFPFADPKMVGVRSPEEVFISSPSLITNGVSVRGLVSIVRGFEHHPYLDGSGDHVNENHLSVLFLQVATVMARKRPNIFENLSSGVPLVRISYKLRLKNVVELGLEFKVQFIIIGKKKIQKSKNGGLPSSGTCFSIKLWQNSKLCVHGEIVYAPMFSSSLLTLSSNI